MRQGLGWSWCRSGILSDVKKTASITFLHNCRKWCFATPQVAQELKIILHTAARSSRKVSKRDCDGVTYPSARKKEKLWICSMILPCALPHLRNNSHLPWSQRLRDAQKGNSDRDFDPPTSDLRPCQIQSHGKSGESCRR